MKFPFRRRTVVILGVVTVIILLIAASLLRKPKDERVTQAVSRGDLVQTVEVTGEVETVSELDLAFEQGGTISRVNVEVGETIQAGDILASLSAADLAADLARAQAALNVQRAESRVEDIAIAQANVDLAQAALSAAESDLDYAQSAEGLEITANNAQIVQAQETLSQAEVSLSQIQNDNDDVLRDTAEDVLLASDDSLIAVRAALAAADSVLGVENQIINDGFDNELAAADVQALNDATGTFDLAAEARDQAEELLYQLTDSSLQSEIDLAISTVMEALELTSDTLLFTRQVLDATAGGSIDLSFVKLDEFKADIDAQRNAVQAQLVAMTDAVNAYTDSSADVTNDLESAEAEVAAAQAALVVAQAAAAQNNLGAAQQIVTAGNSVAQRSSDLVKAQAELDKLLAGARQVDLAPYEADVLAAQARLAKTQIIAPFDGVVTNLDIKPGQRILTGDLALSVEALDDQYILPVTIPESDIAKVSVGDSATVTLDAFGSRQEFVAKVISIEKGETLIEGVVYYEAKLMFDNQVGLETLRSGMSADVTINTDERNDVLFLPQRAVLAREDGQTYVRIKTGDDSFEERNVSVGLRADDGLLEILNGVNEGEVVIVSLNE